MALLLCVGCRAEVAPQPDLGGSDFAVPLADFAIEDGFDLGPSDLFCSGPVVAEICGNGCDDDKNGYTDGDDPACTPQLLGTPSPASMLYRLLLQPMAHSLLLDANTLQPSSFAVADRSLVPGVAFIVSESAASAGLLRRLVLTTDGSKGTYSDFAPGYVTRDVCIFNGEVIVVQRAQNSILHRFMSDGKTEVGMVALPALADGNVMATGCTGGDGRLVVAVHDLAGSPTQFLVYDSLSASPSMRNVPTDLLNAGIDRCLDLAWTPSGFYGLFVALTDIPTNPNNDPGASSGLVYPFALDGGVGPPIDAGVLHGLGTFLP